jgi:hypothetical protein
VANGSILFDIAIQTYRRFVFSRKKSLSKLIVDYTQ